MRFFLGLAAIVTMGYLVLAADAPSKVTYVGHDKVTTALAKGGPLVNGPDLLVSGSHRDKAGQVLPMAIVRLYGVVCEEGEDCGGPNRPPRELKAEAQADKDGKFIAVVPHP